MGIFKSAVSSALRIANPNASAAYDAYKAATSKPIRPPANTLSPAQNASAFSLSKQGSPSQPQGLINTSMNSTGALPPLRPPSSGNGAGGGGGGSWGDTPTFNPPKPINAPNLLGSTASSPYYKPTAGVPKPPTTQVSQAPMRPPVSMSGYTSTDPAVQEKIKAMQSGNTNPTPQTTPPATPPVAPTTPSTTPPITSPTSSNSSQMSREDQLAALQKAYLDSLNPSSDQTDVEAKLRDIAAQQANLNASEQLGLNKIKDQAIPMDLLVGQGASLQRQVEGQQGALTAQATPLEAQLASIQARRAAAQQATKDSIGFEQDRLDREQKQNTPIEVGGNLVRRNADGSYESVFQTPGKDSEGFTLGEGQQRYDAKGNLVASGGAKPVDTTNDIKEYNFAKSQGFTGSFVDFKNQKDSQGSTPSSYKEWQLAGSPGTYQDWVKSPTGSSKAPSAEMLKLQANVQSGLDSLKTLKDAENGFTGPLGLYGRQTLVGNGAYGAAKNNLVDVIGRLRSGGAISEDEGKRFSAMLPGTLDSDTTAKYKLDEIEKFLTNTLANNSNPSSSSSSSIEQAASQAGYDPAEIQQMRASGLYTEEQIRQFLGKTNDLSMSQNGSVRIPQSSKLAYVNNNPGNLRFVGQAGATQGTGGFARFSSPQAGYEALKNQIKYDASKGHTLASFINKYAPPVENNTSQYIQQIMQATGAGPDTPINQINLDVLARAMARKESSTNIA